MLNSSNGKYIYDIESNSSRALLLGEICKRCYNFNIMLSYILSLIYFTVSLVLIGFPLYVVSMSSVVRIISIFLGVVLFINNGLAILISALKLKKFKKVNIPKGLTDEAFIGFLNNLLLNDSVFIVKSKDLVLCKVLNSYLNNKPYLDTYLIIKLYSVKDIDAILAYYEEFGYFTPTYREATIGYDTFREFANTLKSGVIVTNTFYNSLNTVFAENVRE